MILIGVTGQKGSGKDTFAKRLYRHGFIQLRFADTLKDMLRVLLAAGGIQHQEDIEQWIEGRLKETPCPILGGKTPRFAMQTLGTEWRNMIDEQLWTRITESQIRISQQERKQELIVITDLRFQHELEMIKRLGGLAVRITRPGYEPSAHPSEAGIASLQVEFEFLNDLGISELYDKADAMLEYLKGWTGPGDNSR